MIKIGAGYLQFAPRSDSGLSEITQCGTKQLDITMDKREFAKARAKLGKTQNQMAALLKSSPKAIQSYEQGWRSIPAHAERQILLLLSLKAKPRNRKPCWKVRGCSSEQRRECPAWEFKAGTLCWFINGTLCEGEAQRDWASKMKICRRCGVMSSLFGAEGRDGREE